MTLIRHMTAAALAGLVATASPAWADDYGTQSQNEWSQQDQIGALLFGLTALAVIAGMASDRDDDDDDDDDRRRDGRTIIAPPDGGRTIVAPPPPGTRPSNPDRIPAQCLRTIQTDRGPAPLYIRTCMREHYYFIDSLPQHCFVETRSSRGNKRFGWSPYCLSQAGYDVRY